MLFVFSFQKASLRSDLSDSFGGVMATARKCGSRTAEGPRVQSLVSRMPASRAWPFPTSSALVCGTDRLGYQCWRG
jgi:hypothetical protein